MRRESGKGLLQGRKLSLVACNIPFKPDEDLRHTGVEGFRDAGLVDPGQQALKLKITRSLGLRFGCLGGAHSHKSAAGGLLPGLGACDPVTQILDLHLQTLKPFRTDQRDIGPKILNPVFRLF